MLADGFGRRIDYLRLSVTDRCDLRCSYCMPAGFKDYEEPARWLSFDEIERLLSVFARLGLKRIRLTGGEPLLRRNLPDLARRLAALPGIDDLSLSTNGTQLAKYASRLRQAGVTRLNVSLDSLDRERVRVISKRDVLPQVLEGLEAARQEGFRLIKINMVAVAGTTDDEIHAMVAYCMERGFVLRLIETMPVGEAGRSAGFLDLRPVRERLRQRFAGGRRSSRRRTGTLPGLARRPVPDRFHHADLPAFLRDLQPGETVRRWHIASVSGSERSGCAGPR